MIDEQNILSHIRERTTNNISKKIKKQLDKNKKAGIIQIFTDGSCIENDSEHPGTFAFVAVYNNKIIFEYSNHSLITTNNRMELSAIILASKFAKQIYDKIGVKSLIHSDSQYSVNTLYNGWKGEKNKDLRLSFYDLNINKATVSCEWIKAHDGNILNEYADKMCWLEYNNISDGYLKDKCVYSNLDNED